MDNEQKEGYVINYGMIQQRKNKLEKGEKPGDATKVDGIGKKPSVEQMQEPVVESNVGSYSIIIDGKKAYRLVNGKRIPMIGDVGEIAEKAAERGILFKVIKNESELDDSKGEIA